MLDPDQAPAEQLAGTYTQPWELETAVNELKTHQRGPRPPQHASRHPAAVRLIPLHLGLRGSR